jgi:hypothetical protein
MDKLKQYLQEHRREMDVEIPPTDLLPLIHAGASAGAGVSAVVIKSIIAFSALAVIGSGVWLAMHTQKPAYTPAPVTPPKEVIQKDTVPVQKDTVPAMQVQPVIKHKKIKKAPPSPPVIHKHKKNVDTAIPPTPPRIKKNRDTIHPAIMPHPTKKVNPPQPPPPARPKKKTSPPIT